MSRIFSTETKTTTRPRHDATIRIQFLGPDDTSWHGEWRTVQLYEFHPDFDTRLKFRSYAYTSIPDDVVQGGRYHTGVYHVMGQGYLEYPYLNVRETVIHEEDLRELMDYCRKETDLHKRYFPIIIHPQPLPFPMFGKGDRVTVIGKDSHDSEDRIGQTGTVQGIAALAACVAFTSIMMSTTEAPTGESINPSACPLSACVSWSRANTCTSLSASGNINVR